MCVKSTDQVRAREIGHSGDTTPTSSYFGPVFAFAFGLALCGQKYVVRLFLNFYVAALYLKTAFHQE